MLRITASTTRRLLSLTIFLLVAAAPIACGPAITAQRRTPVGPHFSILTYNVNFGRPSACETVIAIRRIDADIVCLQETSPAWQKHLSEGLKGQYPYERYRHYGKAGGLAVLSKMPFKDIAYTNPKPGFFPSWVVQADTPLGPVQICQVHLNAPIVKEGTASLCKYLKNGETHIAELSEVFGSLDTKLPRLILGDFNENDHGGGIKWLREKGFSDALSKFDTSCDTWRWKYGILTFRDRLDHITYSKDLRPASTWVVYEGKSDHFPLMAIIERNGQAAK